MCVVSLLATTDAAFSDPFGDVFIFAVSQRRTTHQKERGMQVARKKPMPRAAATRTKEPWSSMKKARREGINEK